MSCEMSGDAYKYFDWERSSRAGGKFLFQIRDFQPSKTVRHILFFKEGRMTSSLAVYGRNHPYFSVFLGVGEI